MKAIMVVIHLLFSCLSYVAFWVAFVASLVFLIQERRLKRKQLGVFFYRMPSLESLDRLNFLAIGIGFGMLSIGLLCGFISSKLAFGQWWHGDPKEYLTLTLWVAYLVLWIVRMRSTLRGRRVALLSVLGFSMVLFTGVGASFLLSSTHPYL